MRSFLVRKINNFTKTLFLRAKVPNTYGARLYISLSFSISLFVSISLFLSFSLSIYISLSFSISLFLCLHLSLSVSFPLYLYISLSFSISLFDNTAILVDNPGPLQPFYTHILNVVLLYTGCSQLCLIIIFCVFLLTCFFGHFVICSVLIYIFIYFYNLYI